MRWKVGKIFSINGVISTVEVLICIMTVAFFTLAFANGYTHFAMFFTTFIISIASGFICFASIKLHKATVVRTCIAHNSITVRYVKEHLNTYGIDDTWFCNVQNLFEESGVMRSENYTADMAFVGDSASIDLWFKDKEHAAMFCLKLGIRTLESLVSDSTNLMTLLDAPIGKPTSKLSLLFI